MTCRVAVRIRYACHDAGLSPAARRRARARARQAPRCSARVCSRRMARPWPMRPSISSAPSCSRRASRRSTPGSRRAACARTSTDSCATRPTGSGCTVMRASTTRRSKAACARPRNASTRRCSARSRPTGCPHLLRLWNYFSDINEDSDGLERYRHFNVGRQQAFLDAKRSAFEGAPAACALGTRSGAAARVFPRRPQRAGRDREPAPGQRLPLSRPVRPAHARRSRARRSPMPAAAGRRCSSRAPRASSTTQTVHVGDVRRADAKNACATSMRCCGRPRSARAQPFDAAELQLHDQRAAP